MARLGERVRAIIGGIEQHRVPRESASWGTAAAAAFGGEVTARAASWGGGAWCSVQWGERQRRDAEGAVLACGKTERWHGRWRRARIYGFRP
jgi:hypothetical protein